MNRILLFISVVFLVQQTLFAQCTPDANANAVGLYPEILESFCLNENYSDTLTFVLPPDTLVSNINIPIDSIMVDGVSNLPSGVVASCQYPSCMFYGNPPNNIVGCLSFTGIPTDIPTNDTIEVNVTAWATIFGNPVPFQQTFRQVRMPGENCAPGNECAGSIAIDNLFGGAINVPQTSSLYDNTNNTSVGDPENGFGYECFFNGDGLQNTIWYSFVGDGNAYNITTVECNATNYISFGDTQAALYSGNCGFPTPVACEEDEDASTGAYNFDMNVMLQNGVQYYLMIDAYSTFPGEFCLEVTRQNTVSVTESDFETVYTYPNPTNNVVNWTGIAAQAAEVFDNTGRSVLTVAQPNGTIDVSELTEGIYILKLFTEDGAYTSRVVKQ